VAPVSSIAFRRSFYEELSLELRASLPDVQPVVDGDRLSFQAGEHGAFSIWFPGAELRVVLLVGASAFARVLAGRTDVERALGHSLLWEDGPDCWIGVRRDLPDLTNPGERADAVAWAVWHAGRLMPVLQDRLAE
jgi:hypothetical protein